jgi:hypothetical protein
VDELEKTDRGNGRVDGKVIDFRTTRLRSNPRLRLLSFDECDERERLLLEPLARDSNFYGILVPPDASPAPTKSMSRDAALLFMSLREPACVPHLLTSLFGDSIQERLQELVLDGVFEIEQEGVFTSGSVALPKRRHDSRDKFHSLVAQLSADAIVYVTAAEGLSPRDAAVRLYMYNRVPCTPALQRKFAGDDDVLAFLTGKTALAKRLQKHWVRDVSQEAWLVWHQASSSSHSFKLFVSPTLDGLPQTFQVAVDTFCRVKCSHFKVGRTAFGLLRPDKFVAYFDSLEQVKEAAELIRASTSGITAQGVPFTAAIDTDGLTSWGMDPPKFEQVMAWQEHQSWRQWVTERLAVYTLAAKENGADNVVDFALHRIGLDGVNPDTWTPNLAIWRGSVGTEEGAA